MNLIDSKDKAQGHPQEKQESNTNSSVHMELLILSSENVPYTESG